MKLKFETLENKELLAGDTITAVEPAVQTVTVCNIVYPQTCYEIELVDSVFEQIGGRRARTVRQTW